MSGFTEIFSGSYQNQLRTRARKLQKRNKPQSSFAETSLSLRRKISSEPGGLIGLLAKPLPNMKKLDDRLKAAHMTISAKVFVLRGIIVAIICAVIAVVLHKPLLMGLLFGIVLGLGVPMKLITIRINSHMKKFLKIFPDGIDLIVRGLRSGLPVSESFRMVGNEVPEPVGEVFRRVVSMMELGVPMETALQEVARSLNNTEFNFFATSIILQRETGGNLGEILSNLSDVLRRRFMMQMKVKAMTSEARASAWIIGSLPIIVGIAVSVMSPGYMNIMFEDYRGNMALAGAICLLSSGVWIMGRMAKFDV
jgi:tight adherence protein B